MIKRNNPFVEFVLNHIQHYNPKKYWKRRTEVINPKSKKPKLIRLLWLLYIKKADAFNNCSFGTDLGNGAVFKSTPYLPHRLNGIVIGHNVVIGNNCTICQHVTIMHGGCSPTTIGDNCFIGAGAVVLSGVVIGDNVRIGANAVVTKDVPSNCKVVGVPAKIVKMNNDIAE